MTAFLVLYTDAARGLINMALHDMAIQTTSHLHGTFYIHLIPDL